MEKKGFVAVHLGAGYHSRSKESLYKALCKKALAHGMTMIRNEEAASRIVSTIISILEDSPLTNAGVGSNLTVDGKVECDAGLMDGETGLFGGVGALRQVKNPIRVAEELIYYQKENEGTSELVPPLVLVGEGASDFAASRELETVDDDDLITDVALRTYERCQIRFADSNGNLGCQNRTKKRRMGEETSDSESSAESLSASSGDGTCDVRDGIVKECGGLRHHELTGGRRSCELLNPAKYLVASSYGKNFGCQKKEVGLWTRQSGGGNSMPVDSETLDLSDGSPWTSKGSRPRFDTIGAVCVDSSGKSCAGVSSGGLILKLPGRVGHASMFGSGCWASSSRDSVATASCTSGCGEQILRTFLAKECCEFLEQTGDNEILDPSTFFRKKFLDSRQLPGQAEKLAGIIGLLFKRSSHQERTDQTSKQGTHARSALRMATNKNEAATGHVSLNGRDDNEVYILDDQMEPHPFLEPLTNGLSPESDEQERLSDTPGYGRVSMNSEHQTILENSLDFIIAHSTSSFCVGFFGGDDRTPTIMISRMPDSDLTGKSASGHVFHYDW